MLYEVITDLNQSLTSLLRAFLIQPGAFSNKVSLPSKIKITSKAMFTILQISIQIKNLTLTLLRKVKKVKKNQWKPTLSRPS